MDEVTATSLWSWLETTYMTKSLFNKLYLKRQLYELCMDKETTVVRASKFFQSIIDLLAVDVKVDEKDKVSILLNTLLESYDHILYHSLLGLPLQLPVLTIS